MEQDLPPHVEDDDTDPGMTLPVEDGPSPDAEEHEPIPWKKLVPWGSLMFLIAYTVAAVIFVVASHVTSDEYVISQRIEAAERLLGEEDGRDRDEAQLAAAAQGYLEALLIDPDLGLAHKRLETIKWRFQERSVEFPPHLHQQHAAIAMKSKSGKEPTGLFKDMAVTAEDAYHLSAVKKSLASNVRWAVVGFVLIGIWVGFRAWQRHQDELARRKKADDENEDKGTAMY